MLGFHERTTDDGLDVTASVAAHGLPSGPASQDVVVLQFETGEARQVGVDAAQEVRRRASVGVTTSEIASQEQTGDIGGFELLLARLAEVAYE
jgi:hypothetical protein